MSLRVEAERRGRLAEGAAALFLAMKGYRILSRRFRAREGEIDLASILRDLAGSGYTGPVSMEIEFTDYEYPPWEECVEAARRGKAYWDSLDVAKATARGADAS